jgi:type IV pilus assembly protein PilW
MDAQKIRIRVFAACFAAVSITAPAIAQTPATGASAPAALISPIFTRIYYVSSCSNQTNCSAAGADSVPTLKRIDVTPGATSISAVTDGIENLQFEYGQDGDNDGAPNSYSTTTALPSTVAAWADVVSVRVHLLARNTDATGGFTDVKTYALGSGTSVTPGGAFKRHAYDEVARDLIQLATGAHSGTARVVPEKH